MGQKVETHGCRFGRQGNLVLILQAGPGDVSNYARNENE